jgi:hypothetical protein
MYVFLRQCRDSYDPAENLQHSACCTGLTMPMVTKSVWAFALWFFRDLPTRHHHMFMRSHHTNCKNNDNWGCANRWFMWDPLDHACDEFGLFEQKSDGFHDNVFEQCHGLQGRTSDEFPTERFEKTSEPWDPQTNGFHGIHGLLGLFVVPSRYSAGPPGCIFESGACPTRARIRNVVAPIATFRI